MDCYSKGVDLRHSKLKLIDRRTHSLFTSECVQNLRIAELFATAILHMKRPLTQTSSTCLEVGMPAILHPHSTHEEVLLFTDFRYPVPSGAYSCPSSSNIAETLVHYWLHMYMNVTATAIISPSQFLGLSSVLPIQNVQESSVRGLLLEVVCPQQSRTLATERRWDP